MFTLNAGDHELNDRKTLTEKKYQLEEFQKTSTEGFFQVSKRELIRTLGQGFVPGITVL